MTYCPQILAIVLAIDHCTCDSCIRTNSYHSETLKASPHAYANVHAANEKGVLTVVQQMLGHFEPST